MVGQTITAIDDATLDPNDVTVVGNADLYYSSPVLKKLELELRARYSVVYYDEK
jgi:hypothetical protein